MARPIKNYCDYFPHDAGMRNHRKVKAIITRFGVNGYAYWSMLLEVLTATDNFTLSLKTDIDWELLSSDLHTSSDTLKEFIGYLITLSLLQTENGLYWSDTLIERFSSLLNKRIRAKKAFEEGKQIEEKIGKKIQSTNGINRATRLAVFEKCDFKCTICDISDPNVLDVHHKIPRYKGGSDEVENLELLCANCHRKEHLGEVSVAENRFKTFENTQSKVNEIKEDKKELNIDFDVFWDLYDKKRGLKDKVKEKWNKLTNLEREQAMSYIPKYKESQPDKTYRKDPMTFINNKSWNDEIIIPFSKSGASSRQMTPYELEIEKKRQEALNRSHQYS